MPKSKEERYQAKKSGENTWSIYDNVRKCSIVKSMSPQAKYNQQVVEQIAKLLNLNP